MMTTGIESNEREIEDSDKDFQIEEAIQLYKNNNLDESKVKFLSLLSSGINDTKIYLYLGSIYERSGKIEKAIQNWNDSISVYPLQYEFYYKLGVNQIKVSNLIDAKKNLLKSIELNQNYTDAYSSLSTIYQSLNDFVKAEDCLRKALTINPKCAIINYNLGSLLLMLGKNKEAEHYTQESISINDKIPQSFLNLGCIYYASGQLERAALNTRKAIDLNPNNYLAFSNLGNILRQMNKLDEAESLVRKALEINPKSEQAYINLGRIFEDKGNIQEADLSYRSVINLNKNSELAYINLGRLYKKISKVQEAEVFIRQAIQFNSYNTESYVILANILIEVKKFREAESISRKAIDINPKLSSAYFSLGISLFALFNFKEAEISFKKAIDLDQSNANCYIKLGTVLFEQGKIEEAELATRKAIEINPNIIESYKVLGFILRSLGKTQEAIISIRKFVDIYPNDIRSNILLGYLLKDCGKSKEALDCWEEAYKNNPNSEAISFELGQHYYLKSKYESAIKFLDKNNSNRCQSLHLGCLLALDREDDFHKKYQDINDQNICNPEIGSIIDHANIIYERKSNSTFCNEAIKYIFVEKINGNSYSDNNMNQFISYLKSENNQSKSQSLLINGQQTSGELFRLSFPFIKEMRKVIEQKVINYKSRFKESNEGFIQKWPEKYDLRAWAVVMNKGGFLRPHNHTYGWLSGSFYLHVPKLKNDPNEGSIAFTYKGPHYSERDVDFKLSVKQVETRDLCLFPSSLYHYTIPFDSNEDRICFVFDLIPLS